MSRDELTCREACELAAEPKESAPSPAEIAVVVAGSVERQYGATRPAAAMHALAGWVRMDDATVASVARALAAWVEVP